MGRTFSRVIIDDIEEVLSPIQTDTTAIVADTNALETERLQRVTGAMAEDTNSTGSLENVVNITDKGVLTGVSTSVSSYTGVGEIVLKVIIDGVTIYNTVLLAFEAKGQSNSIAFNHRFDTSLQIQHSQSGTAMVRTIATYTTD